MKTQSIDRSAFLRQLAEQRERRRKRSKIEDSSTERKVEDVRQNVEEEDTKMDESKETEKNNVHDIGLDIMLGGVKQESSITMDTSSGDDDDVIILDDEPVVKKERKKKKKKKRFNKPVTVDDDDVLDLTGLDSMVQLDRETKIDSDDDDDDVIDLSGGLNVMLKREVTTIDDDDDDDDDVIDLVTDRMFSTPDVFIRSDVLLGTLTCKCTGLQYYPGEVRNREYVKVVREPRNPYDANAVRVDNMNGAKIGHIERLRAKSISIVMDQRKTIKIEALVCEVPTHGYTCQVKLSFYGRVQDEPFLRTAIGALLKQDGTRFDVNVSSKKFGRFSLPKRRFATTTTTTTTTTNATTNGNDDEQDLTWAPSQLHWSQKDNDWTFGETFEFDAEKTKKELDEMFDKMPCKN